MKCLVVNAMPLATGPLKIFRLKPLNAPLMIPSLVNISVNVFIMPHQIKLLFEVVGAPLSKDPMTCILLLVTSIGYDTS